MQNKVRAQSNTKCVQCGRNIFKGDECYQYATGIGVLGYGKVFCSEGCINAYKGAANSGSEPSSRSRKVRRGFSFGSASFLVKAIVYFFAFAIIMAIGISIYSCIEDAGAEKAAKKMPAAEYIVDKSSVILTGNFNDYFDVVDDMTVVTKEGAYEAVVTLDLKCKKELKSVDYLGTTLLWFNYEFDMGDDRCKTTPDEETIGATLYAMKAGEERQIKIKFVPNPGRGKSAINTYKNFLEAAEMGTVSISYMYLDKKKWQKEF